MPNEIPLLLAHTRGLAVSAKRTYRLSPGGRAVLADEQPPLATDLDVQGGVLVRDTEALAFKTGTDVVVAASAHVPGGRPVRELLASVAVKGRVLTLRVSGRRRVVRDGGRWAFSDPEPFAERALTWREAYGGVDVFTRNEIDPPFLAALQKYVSYDLSGVTKAAYPRNPVGKGYVIRERPEAEGLELPTVEDPDDLLTPARLFAGHEDAWFRQPLPAGLGFLSYGWFPRSAYCGLEKVDLPPGVDPASVVIPEVARGWAPADVVASRPLAARVGEKASNGAAPQLVFEPHLRGGEEVELVNLDAREPRLAFTLPGERPAIEITPLGEERQEVPPRLMTVSVDVPGRLVSLVWAGTVVPRLPHTSQHVPRVPYRVRW